MDGDNGAIDPEVMEELRALEIQGDPGFFQSLISGYLADAPIRLSALLAAVKSSDALAIKAAAHVFKGSSLNIGANGLAALCAKLETMGRSGKTEGAAEIVPALTREFDRVVADLNGYKR